MGKNFVKGADMFADQQVYFGGAGIDRAAHLRGEITLEGAGNPLLHLFWRGKPLVDGDHLTPVSRDHPLVDHTGDAIFLGLIDDRPIFAQDVSAWVPPREQALETSLLLDTSDQTYPGLPGAFIDLRLYLGRLPAADAELAAMAKAQFEWHRSHQFCSACGTPSTLSQTGWQRDCPSCDRSHFPRTDPVVIMLITHGNSVLLGRSPGWPDRMYSLLAGFVEAGETIEAAVRREVAEESGIEVGAVSYLACQPWPFPNSLMIGCAGTALTVEIEVDPKELEDAVWLSREGLAEAFAGGHPWLDPAREGSIAHYLLKNWLEDRFD